MHVLCDKDQELVKLMGQNFLQFCRLMRAGKVEEADQAIVNTTNKLRAEGSDIEGILEAHLADRDELCTAADLESGNISPIGHA